MSTRADAVFDAEFRALRDEIVAWAETPPAERARMVPSDELLMSGIVEWLREWGGWRTGSAIVGCRLSDAGGLTICEVPSGNEGWALLRRLVREGRIEKRLRVKGRVGRRVVAGATTYAVYRAPVA